MPLPERPLPGLAVAGQEHGERPVLDPDADRVVVLVLGFSGGWGSTVRTTEPSSILRGLSVGKIACMPLSRTRVEAA